TITLLNGISRSCRSSSSSQGINRSTGAALQIAIAAKTTTEAIRSIRGFNSRKLSESKPSSATQQEDFRELPPPFLVEARNEQATPREQTAEARRISYFFLFYFTKLGRTYSTWLREGPRSEGGESRKTARFLIADESIPPAILSRKSAGSIVFGDQP